MSNEFEKLLNKIVEAIPVPEFKRMGLSENIGFDLSDYTLNLQKAIQKVLEPEWKKLMDGVWDDEELDGTDFAHPAYWRGQDKVVQLFIKKVEKILNGKDDGSGVTNPKEFERLRRRMLQTPPDWMQPSYHHGFEKGYDKAMKETVKMVENILDGKDDGGGLYSNSEQEDLRQRMLKI